MEYHIPLFPSSDGSMKIVVDPLQCACSGYCVKVAPAIFGWLPDNTAAVAFAEPTVEEERQLAREAAQICPARAISIVEDQDGQ